MGKKAKAGEHHEMGVPHAAIGGFHMESYKIDHDDSANIQPSVLPLNPQPSTLNPELSPQHSRLLTNFGHKIPAKTKLLFLVFGFRQNQYR